MFTYKVTGRRLNHAWDRCSLEVVAASEEEAREMVSRMNVDWEDAGKYSSDDPIFEVKWLMSDYGITGKMRPITLLAKDLQFRLMGRS